MQIKTIKFDRLSVSNIKDKYYGSNWPSVYILNNKKDAYVGETTNINMRSNQHLANELKSQLENMTIITDKTFNKSTIIDLESFLIEYMSADNNFQLLNGNKGIQNHNYYQREYYQGLFKEIWNELRLKNIARNDLKVIENSDLFKFSPYKNLTVDQYLIVNNLLSDISTSVDKNLPAKIVITGGAGTGKTVLGIYLMKLFTATNDFIKVQDDDIYNNLENIQEAMSRENDAIKIGLVIPMANLRKTLKKVFKNIKGLNSKMVLSPHEVVKSNEIYDLLIVDEAHRLRQRKNLTQYKSFDDNNTKLGLSKWGTELDWITLKSKYQIFFYDAEQSIKLTDVPKEEFDLIWEDQSFSYHLRSQLRCKNGGEEYVKYVKSIFSNYPPSKKTTFKGYEFKLFDDVTEMFNEIKIKNETYGLSRVIAGYSWRWKTKDVKINKLLTDNEMEDLLKENFDIKIGSNKYIWNTQATDWINSPNSINEVGSIHTIQGYDLNYCGLIVGNELKYDPEEKRIFVDRDEYYDTKGKNSTNDEELLEYIFNIYSTMATRGIHGTYIYICDVELRKYFEQYISKNDYL